MAKREAERYGMAVVDKYRDNAYDIMSKYNLDTRPQWQKDLAQNQQDFSNYLSSGNYSVENNQKYRDIANQAVTDLSEQQKKYKKNSDEYNTIGSYLNYYENAIPNFDRMDVTANARDYLSYDPNSQKFNNWHSEEDYNTQKAYLDQKRMDLQAEMDALGETESTDYQALKSWQEQYDALAEALEERNRYDRQFESVDDYTAFERSSDYKNSIQAKQTLKEAQDQLTAMEDRMSALQMKFSGYSDVSALSDQDTAEYNELLQLQQDIAKQKSNVLAATAEVAGLEKWQKDAAIANYYQQYGLDADYETILNDLIQARDKAEEGSEDRAKIDLQIRALAGENEDGRDANGLYDTSTLYGRAVMRDFDTEAAQKRLEEIDAELTDLGVPLSRAGGYFNANGGGTGLSIHQGEGTAEEDPRVMELRREKTELTRKMNSAEKFQGKYDVESKYASLPDEDKAKLIEEGKKHVSDDNQVYYRANAEDPAQGGARLKNFEYLDDEIGGDLRDMMLAAIGAEYLGADIGFTADEALKLYEEDMAQIAGMKRAKKVSDMDSDFARWNTQVFGVGTLAGLNQFGTGVKQFFTDDYVAPNSTAVMGQYTRKDLERYGDERWFANGEQGGSNLSQLVFDTTQTTANMLPMIAASALLSAAGAAPVAGELVGAGLMGVSSAGNAYQQALAEGWDKTDARVFSTITGAAEGAMQYLIGGISGLGGVGEEQLLKYATGINNAAVRFATETGVHILSETTEELAQNRLERYLRWQFNDENSDWYSWTDDDWYTVVVTALSTGALEAPGAAKSTFGAQRLGEQLSGQRIIPSKQEQGGNAVISEIGKAMQSDSALSYTLIAMATDTEMQGTDAYELAGRMESGKAPKNAMNLGNLYRDIVNEYVARNGKGGYEDATAAIIGGATKYNALQSAKTELEAADQRASEVRKENPGAEVLNANATELQGYGVNNTKQATEYGAILNKVMSGTDISDAEMDKLLGDSTAAKASRLILEKQNNDPVAVQQLRLSLTRENTEGARDVIKAQIQQFREEKAVRKEAEKVSVVQAAMNAANKSEVSRAAANADLQEQVPAATVEAVQKADADVEAAQSRVKQIERMSFKELAAAKDLGLTEEAIDAGVVQDLQKQMAALNERADKLAAVKFPSQQQRTELADIREQQAAIKEQLVAAKMSSQSRVEQRAAAVQQTAAAPVQAEAARSNPNVLVLPNGTQVSREEFVQQRVANGQSEANANAAFDELVAQTAPTQKGNIENGQTTDQNGQRNDVGIEADRGEDQKQGDQSEPSADGRREAGVRELRTESGNLAAEVTENASVVDSDHIEVLSQKYKDLPELTSSLKRSGFKKITYVTEGDLLNVLGQSVPALYNDGELYLCLDYKTDGYDYVATAEHERTHLRLDLMRARFGESDTRTMVTSALQTILGEDSYVEAFKRYAERYGPVYLSHGLDVETVGHMINEEMLCDMVGGINNFGTQLGEYQSETEDLLEASKFNVVMQNLVDNPSEDPGTVETGEIPKGSMPYGIPADTLISTQNVDNPSTQPADASQVSKSAFYGLAEALGFKVDQTGTKNKVYYLNDEDAKLGRNGFTQITVDMIKQSPIGDLIRYSVDKGDITPGQAEQEYNLFASIASITDQTHDFYQAMQFMGSTIFTALKANSDTQYGATYDFPSICTKTQAVINEMSAQMVARGRSLTETEIRQAYNDVFNDGNPVPCPECYVFSRWVGIGGLLDNIRSYQERFGKMSVDEVIAAYNEANKEVLAFAEENGLSKGRAKGSLASLLDKQYKSLEEDIQKRENQGEAVPNKDYEIRDKLAARMSTIRSLTWIDEVYFAGKEHKAGNVNPNFSVPINVLYDLNEGETFARDYKEAWAFRTTQGAGYGKAITPYAEAILGEGMLVTANTTKSIKAKAAGALNNPYQTERGRITDSSARGKNLKTARKKELNQLFIGGQRLQSTSDARFDNAVDYLLAALELQSMKGGAQVYTKVPGAVAFFDICKMCTNMSMMPKGGGLDASGNPVDTSVGGMALNTMVMLRKRFEHAGSITIGVNDAHIRALMKQEFRDFIIPYHASGGKMSLIEAFRQVQDPDLKNQKDSEGNPIKIRSSDYTKTQSDKILSDDLLRSYFGKTEQEIEDIHKFRDTRLWILTAGKSGTYYSDVLDPYAEGLTESQSNARTVLQELYASMQADGKWNGVQLAKGKVEHQIFPNEFWDTKSTYDTSGVNTQRYLDYCDALGFLHRFSGKTISKGQIIPVTGYDQNGNKVELTDLAYDKDGNIEPFFWKTLTDRRMYGNNGQYLEQPTVDLTNLKADTVATFAAPMGERRYNHRVSVTKAAERAANVSRMSNQTEATANAVAEGRSENAVESEGGRKTQARVSENDGRGLPSERREEASVKAEENRNAIKNSAFQKLTEEVMSFLDEYGNPEVEDFRKDFSSDKDFVKYLYEDFYLPANGQMAIFENNTKWATEENSALYDLISRFANENELGSVSRNAIQSIDEVPTEKVTEDAPSVPRYSMREEDPNTLKFLNDQLDKGEVVRAYKTFLELVDEDGNVQLYPPMATVQTGADGKRKMANAMAVGAWEKSVGNPNSKNIIYDPKKKAWYYNLVKENGGSVPAAYDPYQHSSNVVLNDQFESAYQRPNLATYEVVIPKSELTSGYHYEATRDDGQVVRAALPVGEHPWKKGIVAGKLKNTDRTVYMTRWLMPVRKVENSEVAQMYKEILDKEANPVPIPFNVVPPGLQEELEKIGVPIDYEGSGQYKSWGKRYGTDRFPAGKPISRMSIQDNTNDNPYPPNTLQHDLLEAARNGNLSEWVTQQMNAHEDALENAKIRPPVIPSKGFVPKVSEQEKAALEKRRQGLIQAKGAMKPSEKSNGFAMPKADETGNRFRRFLQNAGSAQELKVAQDQVEKFAFTDIASTYVPDSNKADLTWAKDVIHEDGLESAIKQFNREALKMEMPANVTKSLALGQQLLIETSRQGDMQNFLDVLSSLTLLSSQAGKSLQAFRMLKQSGPIGELYYVQKAVKQLNDRHSEKITAGKMAEITVPEDLSKAVLMASDEASRDKAMDDLIAGIAAQVPVTMMDKWNAWRYLAMLGNARTHVRNIIGNAVFVPLRFAKDLMAAGGEFIATKAGLMEEGDRRKSVSVSRELRDFAKQDAKIMQKELQGSGKYNPAREILDARKMLPGFLETLSRKNGQALEYEDWLFLSPAYQKALSQALAHTGYTVEEMQNGSNYDAVKALNNARRIAVEEAQKATYRDFNAAASMLNRIKRMESGKASDKVIGVLLEGILPFTKTPINILRRGVEYSPIGIASSIFEAAAGVKNGNLDVAEFIDHLSAGLSGTAVAVLGYLLASLGYIRGKKDDKEEEFEKLQGYQDYSLQIGDVSATIDWAAPTALPLFTGAAVHSMIRDGESLEWKDAWDAMMMIAEPMMSLSMLDGLNNVLSSASYADDSQKLATVASSAFTSYLGQAFPTLLGQVARSVDGTRRSTYIDKNSPVPTAIQRFVQSSVQNKIPVWESQKIPYIDVWGREDTNDSKVLGALENFLSPSYINVVNTTDVDETLRELYDKTKENSVLPSQVGKYFSVNGERKDLTPDEYVSYAKDVGSTKYTLLAQLFADPRYMALTDEQKAKAISKIYSYATAVGKYHIDQNYDLHGQGKWMEEANAMPTEIQRFNRIWEYLEEYLNK